MYQVTVVLELPNVYSDSRLYEYEHHRPVRRTFFWQNLQLINFARWLGMDINLYMRPGVDTNLYMRPGVDINLDMRPGVDINLDTRPGVPSGVDINLNNLKLKDCL